MRQITTIKGVYQVLDGVPGVAKLVGYPYGRVWNWQDKTHGSLRFPADTYLVIQKALAKRGYTAPAKLWGMREPARTNS